MTEELSQKVLVVNRRIRALENQIGQLHRQHNIIEKELRDLDKYGAVEFIENKFSTIQEKFEFQIQKQRERLDQFDDEIHLHQKFIKWMETCDIWNNDKNNKSPSPKKNNSPKKKKMSSFNRNNWDSKDMPIDFHIENLKQQVFYHFFFFFFIKKIILIMIYLLFFL